MSLHAGVNPVQIEYIHSPQTQKTDFYAPENVKGDVRIQFRDQIARLNP